jgi:hypothetical protein
MTTLLGPAWNVHCTIRRRRLLPGSSTIKETHMTPGIMIGTLFSTALTVGAFAQSTGGQTPSQAGSLENSQVTVTGCLQSAEAAGTPQTAGASAGAAGSGASRGGGFVLTNAKMGTDARTDAAGASSTGSSSSGSRESMTRFKLEGSQSDLQKHAGSLVEVSGKLDKNPSPGATGSATTGATGAAGPTGSGSAATGNAVGSQQEMPTLRVSRVRQVSATCTGS